MTQLGEPYSRIYWSVIEDYPDIYEDDAAFSLWVRMLLEADAAYPMKPRLPRTTRAMGVLADAGLLIIERNRYTILGLTQERDRRSEQGRAGGVASGKARRSTVVERSLNGRSEQTANESNLDETRRDETRQAEGESPAPAKGYDLNEDDPFDAYVLATGRPPSDGGLDWINRMGREHGEIRVASAIIEEWKKEQKMNTLLSRVEATVATARHHEDKSKPKPGYHDGSHGRTCVVCEPLWRDAPHV